jgi:hypothetical protein
VRAVSNEQRTAVQASVAGLLAVAAAFGFITADEVQTYGVASVAVIGAVSSTITAVATWKQRPDNVDVDPEERADQDL